MYKDDAPSAPRNQISDDMLRRLLNETESSPKRCPSSEKSACSPASSLRHNAAEPDCRTTWGLNDYPLASVYAPLQSFRNLYDCNTAFHRGTVFTELDLPFMGVTVQKGGNCHA